MDNILLTGANGFIGSNILNTIRLNYKVYIIQNPDTKKTIIKHKNIKVISFKDYNNLSSKLKKLNINTVIHCATFYKEKHSLKDINKFVKSNILLGNIILENINNFNAMKFINFSTTWEDSDGKRNNPKNLYAAYKSGFANIVEYYKNKNSHITFIDLIVVDTFGKNDSRRKIINTLKTNFKKKRVTKIVSTKLMLNLLNVDDIVDAVKIVLRKNIKNGRYILKNSKYLNLYKLISKINKNSKIKIKVKWLSNNIIKNKIIRYDKLKSWKPQRSNIDDIMNLILN